MPRQGSATEVAACAEQHSQDIFYKHQDDEMHCMAITTPTSLAAGSLPKRLQVGCDDLQGPHNRDTNVPQSASHVASACTDITLVGRSAAHQAFHQNRVREVCFPTLCTNCLELTTEIDHQLRLTASV